MTRESPSIGRDKSSGAETAYQPRPDARRQAEEHAPIAAVGPKNAEPTAPVSTSWLALSAIAYLGTNLAYIVPLSLTLALRVSRLDPGHEEVLGYVLGIAQAIHLALSPLIGMWSDRLRARAGRRTPFIVGGGALGLVSLAGLSLAPNVYLLGIAWVFGLLGWATASQSIGALQAENVPDRQRGRLSMLTGISTQIAPILGVGIAYTVISSTVLVFVLPAAVGFVLMILFPIFKPEAGSREMTRTEPLTARALLAGYVFSPRRFPEFGWSWLGRFLFFMGLYLNSTFSSFFYAQRLGIPVEHVGGALVLIGLLGAVAAIVGALAGGFLSDRFHRRRQFALLGSLFFVAGAVVEAFAHDLSGLLLGAVLMQLAIALFSAVDQAIFLTILPDRNQAGRYLALVGFAQKLPSAIAPLIAPTIILLGASGADKNYTALYLAGGALALSGGLTIFFKVKSAR
jgi:MFS family permease